jgi:hypothetical protein
LRSSRLGEKSSGVIYHSLALLAVSCYGFSMTITQTVEIPESHRLIIDVPREVPTGPIVLTFTLQAARHDWDEAFAKMSEAEEDKLLLPDNIDSASFEWAW